MMWLTGRSLFLFFICCIYQAAAESIKIYHVKNGVVSTKPIYMTSNYKRIITRKEFSENDVVYLVAANPANACTSKIRPPPELLVPISSMPKWILLVDSEPCDQGHFPKIHHAQKKGYDGVIMYSLQSDQGGKQSATIQIPRQIQDGIHITVDLVGFNDGIQLKKFDFRARTSSERYLLKFSSFGEKVYPSGEKTRTTQKTKQAPRPTTSRDTAKEQNIRKTEYSERDIGAEIGFIINLLALIFAIAAISVFLLRRFLAPERLREPAAPAQVSDRSAPRPPFRVAPGDSDRRVPPLTRLTAHPREPPRLREGHDLPASPLNPPLVGAGRQLQGLHVGIERDQGVYLPGVNQTVSAESLQMCFIRTIAAGGFGVVCEMFIQLPRAQNRTHIALKRAKEEAQLTATNDSMASTPEACLAQEIQILHVLPHHDNVVRMLGFSTNKAHLMMEFCESGDLGSLLRRGTYRYSWQELNGFAQGVARGMHHLHANNIIHRDLAARNVLVHRGIAKIADFGMAHVTQDTPFRIETGRVIWAVQWLAPEAFYGIYSTHSDIWAFGIMLWEIFSGGQAPYADMNIQGTVALVERLAQEYRLPKPHGCSDAMYRIMRQCWNMDFQRRPSALQLGDEISGLLEKN